MPDPLDLLTGEARDRVERILNTAQRVEPNPDAQFTPVPEPVDRPFPGAGPFVPPAPPWEKPEPVESPQKAIARRLLTIAAAKKLLDAEDKKLRVEAAALFPDAGDRAAVTLKGGAKLGNVRADPGAAGGWSVTDAGALRAWVEENVPGGIVEQVTTVVEPELVVELLNALAAGEHAGWWVDESTGEEHQAPPPGITHIPAKPPQLKVTPDAAAPDALRAILGDRAPLLGLTS